MGTSLYSHAVFRFLKMSWQQRRVRGEDGSRAPVQSLHCWTRRSATDNASCTKNRTHPYSCESFTPLSRSTRQLVL